MAKVGTFKSKKSRYLALAAVLLIAALLIVTVAVVLSKEDKTPDRRMADGTLYIDTDGSEKYSDTEAVEIDAAYLASVSYTLGNGWYNVIDTFSLGSNMLYIDGDTHIILANDITMTGGVTVTSGNSLSVYAQSAGTDMGRLNRSGTAVTLQAEASLTNTAYISGTSCISGGADIQITNGITGTIKGSSNTGIAISSGKVVNDGLIESGGSMYAGIFSTYSSEIINGKTGLIKSASWGIRLMGGGSVDNSGTVLSTGGATATAIEGVGFTAVINREGALIQGGNDQGIIIGLGGVIENSGTITCTYGSGLYIRPGANSGIPQDRPPADVTVINKETGTIYNFYNYRDDITAAFMSGSTITGTLRMGTGDSAITFAGDPGSSLTYTTVESTSNIGNGNVEVSIDISGLPSTVSVGDVLVLIDGGAAVSGHPKNSEFSDSGYSFDISVAGNQLIATVTAVPLGDTYGISLTPPAYTFPDAMHGYSAQSPGTITVSNTGTVDTGDLSVAISGANASAFTISVTSVGSIAVGGDSTFTVVPKTGLSSGTYTATVTVDPAPGNGNPIAPETVNVSFTVKANTVPPNPPPVQYYYITATADPGATISPAGTVSASAGSSRTFTFSAEPGYYISDLIVDGTYLPQSAIDLGTYTFYNVRSNHTIHVTAVAEEEEAIFLTIEVVEGNGYAEFSVNGGAFQQYVSPVPIPAYSFLDLKAYADDGYTFREWRMGETEYLDSEIPVDVFTESVHLDLYFEKKEGGFPVLPVLIVLIVLIALLLLWFIFFYRRYYDVYIQESSLIDGKDRVHRKSPYTFTMKEGYSGAVAYRIKEDGEWKQVYPDENGKYTIPRGEVIGDIYLEDHPR